MILSIYGQNGAGKTTLATMLVDNYDFIKISFSDALRKATQTFFGINKDWKTDEEWLVDYGYLEGLDRLFSIIKDKNNVKQLMIDKIKLATTKAQAYRTTLELLGTNVFSNMVLCDIWCAVAILDATHKASFGANVVFDDMRFLNERDVLNNLNAVFIRITAPFEEPVGTHESQKYVSDFKADYIIVNDGSKQELLEKFNRLGII